MLFIVLCNKKTDYQMIECINMGKLSFRTGMTTISQLLLIDYPRVKTNPVHCHSRQDGNDTTRYPEVLPCFLNFFGPCGPLPLGIFNLTFSLLNLTHPKSH